MQHWGSLQPRTVRLRVRKRLGQGHSEDIQSKLTKEVLDDIMLSNKGKENSGTGRHLLLRHLSSELTSVCTEVLVPGSG